MHVLVVDDDLFILDLLRTILTADGHHTVECTVSPRDALRKLEAGPGFDCLIYDIVMPDMDGIELCRRTRELRRYRHVPILILTAQQDRASLAKAVEAGATDYITKPFDVLEIELRIQMATRIRRAHQILEHADRLQREEQRTEDRPARTRKEKLTQSEVMNIFAEDLYQSGSR